MIDPAPAFGAAYATTGWWLHFRRDKHWTAEGHRVAAEALARELPALLPEGASPH